METAARKNKLFLYKKQTGSIDFSILLVVTILCAFGLVMDYERSQSTGTVTMVQYPEGTEIPKGPSVHVDFSGSEKAE